MDVISHFAARYERTREEEYSLEEYLELCKRDKLAYATAAERMLQAIGEPVDLAIFAIPASLSRAALEDVGNGGATGYHRGRAHRTATCTWPSRPHFHWCACA